MSAEIDTMPNGGGEGNIGNVTNSIWGYSGNFILISVIAYLIWRIFRSPSSNPYIPEKSLPPMKKRDFTLVQLKEFDGVQNERILIAINGVVFDATTGKQFYGPGGPYSVFAGRDASRGLAHFSLETPPDDYDDLSDLTPDQMDSVKEWQMQFQEKYVYVGRLLKPGEEANTYSDDDSDAKEEATTVPDTSEAKKDS